MDLDSLALLDDWPLLLELLHHPSPDEQVLIGQLVNPVPCLLLEQVISEPPLNGCGFLHQELQVLVRLSGFVHPEVLLDHCGRERGSLGSDEHSLGNLHLLDDLLFVLQAVEDLLLAGDAEVSLGKFDQFMAIHVGDRHFVLGEESGEVHD